MSSVPERIRRTLRRRNLLKRRRIELHRIHAQVEGATTSINDDDSLTLRMLFLVRYPRREQVPDAKVKTCFTLRQETHTSASIKSARDKPSMDDCTSNLLLLRALPAIGMRKDELDLILDRQPYISGVRFPNVGFGALEKVSDEICQNMDNRFAPWKRRDVVVLDVRGGEMFWTEVKFPPGTTREYGVRNGSSRR